MDPVADQVHGFAVNLPGRYITLKIQASAFLELGSLAEHRVQAQEDVGAVATDELASLSELLTFVGGIVELYQGA